MSIAMTPARIPAPDGHGRAPLVAFRGRLVCALVAMTLVAAAAQASNAHASPLPTLTITSPSNEGVINNQTPTFTGTVEGTFGSELPEVILKIYPGTNTGGATVQLPMKTAENYTWSIGPVEKLSPGTYTAVAELIGESVEHRPSVTFTIDTTPPPVTLTFPSPGSSTSGSSQLVSGSAGTAPKDKPEITVQLFAGSRIEAQPPLATANVNASNGSWSVTFSGLGPGTYTVRAQQSDEAGNTGTSEPRTFTVTPAPPPAPPSASFLWVPRAPHVGEQVTLVSNSTDTAAAITSLAWSAAGNEQFVPGGAVFTTSFSKPGAHPVALRVTDANGRFSVARQTIHVTAAPLVLMQPFPVVRIVGREISTGVEINLLNVASPINARVTVTCRGRGCPARRETHMARAGKKTRNLGPVLVTFRRFARRLRSGVVLEIRVTQEGKVGKYTRFTIRRNRLPVRYDSCLAATDPLPITCPS
jgi:hypothetical protein